MKFSKIDVHTHILPSEWPDFAAEFDSSRLVNMKKISTKEGELVTREGKSFRKITHQCWNPVARLEDCDRFGVSKQVLSTVPVMFGYDLKAEHGKTLCRFLNDHLSGVVRSHPDRFVGFASLPMQNATLAVEELERSLSLGLKGIEIGTHINGKNLDDEGFYPLWRALEATSTPVFVHPWDMLGADRMSKYWMPWLVGMPAELNVAISSMVFGGVFEKFPKLKVMFAHGGGSFCFHTGRMDQGFKARPDLCATKMNKKPSEYLGKFFVDSLVHSPNALKFLIESIGLDQICLGTDYPFPLGEENPGALIEGMSLSSLEKDKLLFQSAERFLYERH